MRILEQTFPIQHGDYGFVSDGGPSVILTFRDENMCQRDFDNLLDIESQKFEQFACWLEPVRMFEESPIENSSPNRLFELIREFPQTRLEASFLADVMDH